MVGFLIDAQWFAPASIEALIYLKQQGPNWIPCATLKEWIETPEDERAIKIQTQSGLSVVVERPRNVERFDLFKLMVQTEAAKLTAEGAPPAPSTPPPPPTPGQTLP